MQCDCACHFPFDIYSLRMAKFIFSRRFEKSHFSDFTYDAVLTSVWPTLQYGFSSRKVTKTTEEWYQRTRKKLHIMVEIRGIAEPLFGILKLSSSMIGTMVSKRYFYNLVFPRISATQISVSYICQSLNRGGKSNAG